MYNIQSYTTFCMNNSQWYPISDLTKAKENQQIYWTISAIMYEQVLLNIYGYRLIYSTDKFTVRQGLYPESSQNALSVQVGKAPVQTGPLFSGCP